VLVRLGPGASAETWRLPLAVAAVGSVLLAVVGGVLTWRQWSDGSAFNRDGTARTFGIVVGVEFAVAGIGSAVLSRRRRGELTRNLALSAVTGVGTGSVLVAAAMVSLASMLH
jgi:hypothetical protein